MWQSSDKELTHFEYLHGEASDPRNALIDAMIKGLGTEGSIVAYNKAFEIGVIRQLAEFNQEHEELLLALRERFVDPLPIIKDAVYHEEFRGSLSIKFVAPALLGTSLSYDHLDIGDGSTAQAWADQILRGKIRGNELQKVLEDLRKYCQQNTRAMVELVKWLFAQLV